MARLKTHALEREQWLPATVERVFAFFADAANLQAITPPWLGFRMRTALPVAMGRDARIDYTIRLGPMPMRWRTRITVWEPGTRFVDVQERGPYSLWEHTHEFTAVGNGVLMRDVVHYALPFGPLGTAVHASVVRALLARIFDFRFERVSALFAHGEEAR